ncbi:MgtC/SapB family protein [Candidatus Woesearchaeota archaeon]|nr:MgtC/SapB family protein [Candidatus Woesearchaeota archaeon]
MTGIVFVFVAGFLIGFERGSRGEPAGVRTHTLVCFGAMLFTLISQYVDPLSPSRIAANVVTGMGFLGAGIIMHNRGSVKGLTTAATLWLTAAIGVAIGYGFYVVAVLATLSAFVILKLPHIGEEGFKPESTYLSTALKPDKPPSSTRKKTILKKEGGKKR